MNVLKFCLATCGTFLLSATSANALTILGSFTYDEFTAFTTFPGVFQTTVPTGTVTFNFNTGSNSGTASGFNILSFSNVNGTIITGTGFSTFSPITNLFDVFVARYDFNGDGIILVDFRADFDGLENSIGSVPFTLTTVNSDGTPRETQFISANGTISSFNQAVEVPFEFSPILGLSVMGGLVATRKLLKARKKSKQLSQ